MGYRIDFRSESWVECPSVFTALHRTTSLSPLPRSLPVYLMMKMRQESDAPQSPGNVLRISVDWTDRQRPFNCLMAFLENYRYAA